MNSFHRFSHRLLTSCNVSKRLSPSPWQIQTCSASTKSKTEPAKRTADDVSLTATPQSRISVALTPDGIYKHGGQLLSSTRTIDGKPYFPGRYKRFRLEQGAKVRAGNVVCCQTKLEYHPGLYVGLGRDLTLYSFEDGVVYITWEKSECNWNNWLIQEYYKDEQGTNIYKPYYHVIPYSQHNEFKLVSQV